jgi:hypothetical protein
MSPSGSKISRIEQIERQLSDMMRRMASLPTNTARASQVPRGFYYGVLLEELVYQGEAEVEVWLWNVADAEWQAQDKIVDAKDWFLEEGQSIPAGTKVRVSFNLNTWVVESTLATGLVFFELQEDLTPLESHAKATILVWDADADDWVDTGVEIELFDPFSDPGMWRGLQGYRGWAVARNDTYVDDMGTEEDESDDEERPEYNIVWMETKARVIRFKLKEKFSGGSTSSATAEVASDEYFLQGKDPRDDNGEVEIHDPQEIYDDTVEDCEGLAVYNDREDRYEVVRCQRIYKDASAELASELCGTTPASITEFEGHRVGEFAHDPDPIPTSARNPNGHAGKAGDHVSLRRISATEWEVIDVLLHAVDMMTDIRLESGYIEKGIITVYVELCDDEIDWQQAIETAECE